MPFSLHALKLPLAAIVLIFTFLYVLSLREDLPVPKLAIIPSFPRPKLWSPTPALVSDAHTLATADAFLPHFRAVTAMRGLSMAEAKAGCDWTNPDAVNFMYGGDADWVVQDRNDSELAFRRQQWQDFISHDLLPYDRFKHRFQGRGIAIVAGNEQTVKRVRVLIRALKRLRAQLPIEIHYWNDELTPRMQQDLEALWPRNIFFNDLAATTNIAQTGYNYFTINYQFKTAAVLNSRFAEVLLLDSDNIPIVDPATLFASSTYTTYGTVFWPDIARTRPSNPAWAITNTVCRKDEYEQESGQLLVDKRRYFYHLQLAAWLNNVHGDYYARFLLGDKDMFRFAWHALRTPYGRPQRWLTSVGTLNDGYYCGHTFAQHHPDGDGAVAFLHGGLLKGLPREVMRWQREVNGGVWQVYKRSALAERSEGVEHVTIKWDGGTYYPNRTQETPVWSCTAFYDVEARPLGEIVDGFEAVFEEIGGYWMLDE
ncbi:ADP-heptose:LPS heptosyltransferase-like protein [Diplocarpon rosae]|nr:ADP-heptose:LPS heptosyltransferase-like protein [Diplocarpon rosae]